MMPVKYIKLLFPSILFPALLVAQVNKVDLNNEWLFKNSLENNWLPATVPGCVHTDLLSNKIIKDPFFGTNEKELQWVGQTDWEYKRTLTVSEAMLKNSHVELVFTGLDTYASVFLNGMPILTADNMHREWRKDISTQLRIGENQINITFNNVFKIDTPKYNLAAYKLSAFPNNDQGPVMISMYARKAEYQYGWDWGPRLITCGIWRPVYLEIWKNQKIEQADICQRTISSTIARLSANLNVTSGNVQSAEVLITTGGKEIITKKINLKNGQNNISIPFEIPKPKLWWSNGLGKPNLYTFDITLKTAFGSEKKSLTIGLRNIKIVKKEDDAGRSFYILLNDIPVFIKGANYVPPDNFLSRSNTAKYEKLIRDAANSNMNMLRVWGGGVYENDTFYKVCDQHGILVWQDMMFACAMYPDDKAFVENIRQEILYNIRRLKNHPSVALWCGNNENEISWYSWGWKDKYTIEQQNDYELNLNKLFHDIIPNTIMEVDTTRYYHPSSPSTGFNQIGSNMGDVHFYDVWKGAPYSEYSRQVGRFMSEYGLQAFPDLKTIESFTKPDDRSAYSEVMLSHQRAKDDTNGNPRWGTNQIINYIDMYFKSPKDFESIVYLSQVSQAKGITSAIEAHRRAKPFCMGTMYWQLNDCWPVLSWSGIDYYGRWKGLQYKVKNAYATDLVSIVIEEGKLKIYVISDRTNAFDAKLKITIQDFYGKLVY